jgi:Protein of unknown function DUF104
MVAFPLHIRAVFRDGKFVPIEPFTFPESQEVEITVQSPRIIPPAVTDPAARAKAMDELVARMMSQPLRPDAPKLTRDEMHERR